MDVLYSLFDVNNQRLHMIVKEKTFTNTLTFVLATITDDILSVDDSIVDRFCINILPKIDYNIKSLILESQSMERILLAANYPNLTELKLYNVNDHVISRHFTVESPFRHLFQEQITDLILVYNRAIHILSNNPNEINVYEYTLNVFKNLKHLSVIQCGQLLSIKNLAFTTWSSLNLTKLCIDVFCFDDCFALLDGRLKQLNTFIVRIYYINDELSSVYNMDDLPNMKCFSLRCRCETNQYDTRVLPLLRRMIKLKELTLNIINDERTTLIDGTQINNQILVHMPCLREFIFHISTEVELHHITHHLSNEDIQQTFTNIGYQQVCCILYYMVDSVMCHIFSLPFAFDYLGYIGNAFPPVHFSCVRELTVDDEIPFEHEFFIRIARFFPLLKKLHVFNLEPQSQMKDNLISRNNELYSIVEYPHLISLNLQYSHIYYVEQFLNQSKTHLPQLTTLSVDYSKLRFMSLRDQNGSSIGGGVDDEFELRNNLASTGRLNELSKPVYSKEHNKYAHCTVLFSLGQTSHGTPLQVSASVSNMADTAATSSNDEINKLDDNVNLSAADFDFEDDDYNFSAFDFVTENGNDGLDPTTGGEIKRLKIQIETIKEQTKNSKKQDEKIDLKKQLRKCSKQMKTLKEQQNLTTCDGTLMFGSLSNTMKSNSAIDDNNEDNELKTGFQLVMRAALGMYRA
ncbi:unnamed protein product [Adineta steineri]|uniref:Uncharacterized protein n=4 Tax=Adineta steineri TaxID=433720 RepID=A0A814U1V2_9BILA|nr:unnamed protein product [Adineta steineri]